MKSIQVFYQGEGINGIQHLEIAADRSFADLRAAILAKHAAEGDSLLFLEDADDAVDAAARLGEHAGKNGLKVHLHRCRKVEALVTFNGRTVDRQFQPSATVARVKKWAAEKEFGMTPEEAGEHVLQLVGTQDRPAPGTHLGSLTAHPGCRVSFDLVPNERVNGHNLATARK
jgi:hypothetical protein